MNSEQEFTDKVNKWDNMKSYQENVQAGKGINDYVEPGSPTAIPQEYTDNLTGTKWNFPDNWSALPTEIDPQSTPGKAIDDEIQQLAQVQYPNDVLRQLAYIRGYMTGIREMERKNEQ